MTQENQIKPVPAVDDLADVLMPYTTKDQVWPAARAVQSLWSRGPLSQAPAEDDGLRNALVLLDDVASMTAGCASAVAMRGKVRAAITFLASHRSDPGEKI